MKKAAYFFYPLFFVSLALALTCGTAQAQTPQQDVPKLESYPEYDFVPGDQILLFEDFSQDAVGDFPALWTSNKSGEVKTLNNFPGKWFQY